MMEDESLTRNLFSWSVQNILDENLYKDKVEKIPDTFQSAKHYFESYLFPVLEETRAELCSSMEIISKAPFAEITDFYVTNPKKKSYEVTVDYWRNRFGDRGQEPYQTLPGDIFLITDVKPETVSDLLRYGRTCTFAEVSRVPWDVHKDNDGGLCTDEDENGDVVLSTHFKVNASEYIDVENTMRGPLYVVYLINITTNRRIWDALHKFGNLKIINKVLSSDYQDDISCNICSMENNDDLNEKNSTIFKSMLNDSQTEAVKSCLCMMECGHRSVELIWGPPGTGKTKTVCSLLITLLRMNWRILACAPSNTAVKEMASRVLMLAKESFESDSGKNHLFCSFADILLFGNNKRLKVGSEIEEIYLENRVQILRECFGPVNGWNDCFSSTIDFLENCVAHYHIFLENETVQSCKNVDLKSKSFVEYVRDLFESNASRVRKCIINLCTHIPRSYLLECNFLKMENLYWVLNSLENLLLQDYLVSQDLEEYFSHRYIHIGTSYSLSMKRSECLSVLKDLRSSLSELVLPSYKNDDSIKKFCFERASLIFCTVSNSYKLHSVGFGPLNLLVIDEAAQLKECESVIPLQLPGIEHAILIGDERQLPATVHSVLCDQAGFGRSLFERLSSLGHSKHLLNKQYRMHPSISCFPNAKFYFNKILNGPNVITKDYEKNYLPGPMFGPFSFINVSDGREEFDDAGHSRKNMVEVAAVIKIVRNLYKVWSASAKKIGVGVISPYTAQVQAIQEKIGKKYDKLDGFSVKVKSVDGFQGGEEDIIIISTVRSNVHGSVGFISNHQRTNVALTRARHSLWILGNAETLVSRETIWQALVVDAKARNCYFDAGGDKDLAKSILEVKKELDQLDDLLIGGSVFFKSCRWKVLFSDDFKKSFANLRSAQAKTHVLNVLLKLSSGWRPKQKNVDMVCGSSSHILKQFKIGGLYCICTIDIMKASQYIQVLKIWDLLPLEEIPKLVNRLNGIFVKYTDDYIHHCQEKCFEGGMEVPKCWAYIGDIIQFKNSIEDVRDSKGDEGRSYVENSKVSDSLLLMKFYQLSSAVVSHLLSNRDVKELDLPFDVTDQEREIIHFDKSTFILGRSGTGKTTVLTMKLFRKEQLHHVATEAFYGVQTNTSKNEIVEESTVENEKPVLKQLFVTVSSKLCFAVKQHVSHLKSFARSEEFSPQASLLDINCIDDTTLFEDIPDSFVDIPSTQYPMVMTFYKFLMMLDGTVGISYFEKFHQLRNISRAETGSLRSTELQAFTRTREVNYDRFHSSYWPHFNAQMTKSLEPSRVFTEIMSHIKGGLHSRESCDGKLSRESYILLSEGRTSTLSTQIRENIYDIFQDYEKMKIKNGEFDLADVVNDLHRRLKHEQYVGAEIDFVYIDEVQDLTMRQIALFKYVCRNVEEGFVFSGDTAQTIARGIDFRFQDIRSLFYNEFVLEQRGEGIDEGKEKGLVSEIFQLSQNFRTHAGVLKLAQSVTDLLYHFFPQSIDVLSPETSLIYGEAPVLLESGNDENAIISIFGNSGNAGQNAVGFGAEQVILVRDESARKEVSDYVGNKALVLTIVECKGLEFQDVLLYNFFGSSPLKNQWRVTYEYMKEHGLLDATSSCSFPTFSQAKHNILCSELKHLYVAITRTRQRLWVSENEEDFSEPIFDYWKKLNLIRVLQLDASLAQDMQVASSPEEWKLRGVKLFKEENFEMATMCFERAGDTYMEKYAKAAGIRATAHRMHTSNPEMARRYRREAANIFESIGKADAAAECFYLLEEFEKAGRLYFEKCGVSKIAVAGECFSRAGCYEFAAEVYAKGNFFSECLSVCNQGNLFDVGLQYIQDWKQNTTRIDGMAKKCMEMDQIEHIFLKNCARHYHKLNDNRAMMKFVKAFHSMELMRTFLKDLNCFDELMLIEEESGNFLEAANIAKLRGDLLREVDLLGKAGSVEEAATNILWYVLAYSLWAPGCKGWPLKQFSEKNKLLTKAKAFAKDVSDLFYETVCTEVAILSNGVSSLVEMRKHLNDSRRHNSIRGEILSARKILDLHLHSSTSSYGFGDKLVVDIPRHTEDMISNNRVSIETLINFWNIWKEKIANIFEYLLLLEGEDVNECRSYGDFVLNYLGVWRQFLDTNPKYVVFNSDVHWIKEIKNRYPHGNRKVSIDVRQFVTAARNYWCSELLAVGMKVLDVLQGLHNFSASNYMSTFCQTMPLVHIFEIANYLTENKYVGRKYQGDNRLQKFLQLSTGNFAGCIFPFDWKKSLDESTAFLRGTELCRNLRKGIITDSISSKNGLTYGQIGRVVVAIFGHGVLSKELYEKIEQRFEGHTPWEVFIGNLKLDTSHYDSSELSSCIDGISQGIKVSIVQTLCGALKETYDANWRSYDYISPGCFLYLIERLLIMVSCFQGYFLTTTETFFEWLIYQERATKTSSISISNAVSTFRPILDYVTYLVEQFLKNKQVTLEWMGNSGIGDVYPFLVLRLFVILCLLGVNYGMYNMLYHFLRRNDITYILPQAFYIVLRKMLNHNNMVPNVNIIAEAFRKIENPLVIVSVGEDCSKFSASDSIFVDLRANQSREEIFAELFPMKDPPAYDQTVVEPGIENLSINDGSKEEIPKLLFSDVSSTKVDLQMMAGQFWDMINVLRSARNKEDSMRNFTSLAPIIKVQLANKIRLITSVIAQHCDGDEASQLQAPHMLNEMTVFLIAFSGSAGEVENNFSSIQELAEQVHFRRPYLDTLFSYEVTYPEDKDDIVITKGEDGEADNGIVAAEKGQECAPGEDGEADNGIVASYDDDDKMKTDTKTNNGKKSRNRNKKKKGKGGRRK